MSDTIRRAVARATALVESYPDRGADSEEKLVDILTDLHHYAGVNDLDFHYLMLVAQGHWLEEAGPQIGGDSGTEPDLPAPL